NQGLAVTLRPSATAAPSRHPGAPAGRVAGRVEDGTARLGRMGRRGSFGEVWVGPAPIGAPRDVSAETPGGWRAFPRKRPAAGAGCAARAGVGGAGRVRRGLGWVRAGPEAWGRRSGSGGLRLRGL